MDSNKPSIMLCLATAQTAANILPVMTLKPEQVIIVSSEQMQKQADLLHRWLQKHGGYDKHQLAIEQGVPATGFHGIHEFAMNLFFKLEEQWPNHNIVFNSTGGTKLMALAFVQVFRQADNGMIIYTDTSNDVLEVIEPIDQQPIAIAPAFNIAGYLAAHGREALRADSDETQWRQSAEERKTLTKWLVKHIDKLVDDNGNGLLPQLNGAVHRARTDRWGIKQKENEQALSYVNGQGREVLSRLKDAGLIQWSKERDKTVYFHNPEAMRYLGGGWLEEYVWHIATDNGVPCVAAGQNIQSANNRDDVRNELDLVLVNNNRMLIIECKTGKLNQDASTGSDIIYKLDSLGAHAGGLYCSQLLVSAAPLQHSNRQGRRIKLDSRAHSYDVGTVDYDQLKHFRQTIQHWLEYGDVPR